jgi:hypothetical protein
MGQLLTTVPLAVPTPVQPTNTPIFPTNVLQPNLVPVTSISVNTTPDEFNVMENRCESLENLTKSLDYNKETAEDPQGHVISHTAVAESETQTVELQTSDSNHIEKDGGFVRSKPHEKMKLLHEKQQGQQLQQEKEADDSLTAKKISRFQVSIVQEDVAVSGEFHSIFWVHYVHSDMHSTGRTSLFICRKVAKHLSKGEFSFRRSVLG